jgi:cell division inhibitor SepF
MAQGFRRLMVFLGLDDDDDEYDAGYAESEAPVAAQPPRRHVAADPAPEPLPPPQPSGIRPIPRDAADPTVATPLPSPRRTVVATPKPTVHVVAPVRFSDAQEIADRFKSKQPVIVNLQVRAGTDGDGQGLDRALARRMIDFCSGVTYALSGSMDRVAEQVFLLTPSEVEVSAEERRRLEDQGLYAPQR